MEIISTVTELTSLKPWTIAETAYYQMAAKANQFLTACSGCISISHAIFRMDNQEITAERKYEHWTTLYNVSSFGKQYKLQVTIENWCNFPCESKNPLELIHTIWQIIILRGLTKSFDLFNEWNYCYFLNWIIISIIYRDVRSRRDSHAYMHVSLIRIKSLLKSHDVLISGDFKKVGSSYPIFMQRILNLLIGT